MIMEITLLIMEKSWNFVFEFLWEPCYTCKSQCKTHDSQAEPFCLGQSAPLLFANPRRPDYSADSDLFNGDATRTNMAAMEAILKIVPLL